MKIPVNLKYLTHLSGNKSSWLAFFSTQHFDKGLKNINFMSIVVFMLCFGKLVALQCIQSNNIRTAGAVVLQENAVSLSGKKLDH